MSARDVIAGATGINGTWSAVTKAGFILDALNDAGYRILAPGEMGLREDDIAAALWKAESEDAGVPARIAEGRTREAFDDQSDVLKARWRKFACAAIRRLEGDA